VVILLAARAAGTTLNMSITSGLSDEFPNFLEETIETPYY